MELGESQTKPAKVRLTVELLGVHTVQTALSAILAALSLLGAAVLLVRAARARGHALAVPALAGLDGTGGRTDESQ